MRTSVQAIPTTTMRSVVTGRGSCAWDGHLEVCRGQLDDGRDAASRRERDGDAGQRVPREYYAVVRIGWY